MFKFSVLKRFYTFSYIFLVLLVTQTPANSQWQFRRFSQSLCCGIIGFATATTKLDQLLWDKRPLPRWGKISFSCCGAVSDSASQCRSQHFCFTTPLLPNAPQNEGGKGANSWWWSKWTQPKTWWNWTLCPKWDSINSKQLINKWCYARMIILPGGYGS